jgi:trans-2-enoyl-CoA reductase
LRFVSLGELFAIRFGNAHPQICDLDVSHQKDCAKAGQKKTGKSRFLVAGVTSKHGAITPML